MTRPSEYLANSLRREFSPTSEERAQQFYARGVKYNAIGALKGVHALAFAWAICVTLPCFLAAKIVEGLYDLTRGLMKAVSERG